MSRRTSETRSGLNANGDYRNLIQPAAPTIWVGLNAFGKKILRKHVQPALN